MQKTWDNQNLTTNSLPTGVRTQYLCCGPRKTITLCQSSALNEHTSFITSSMVSSSRRSDAHEQSWFLCKVDVTFQKSVSFTEHVCLTHVSGCKKDRNYSEINYLQNEKNKNIKWNLLAVFGTADNRNVHYKYKNCGKLYGRCREFPVTLYELHYSIHRFTPGNYNILQILQPSLLLLKSFTFCLTGRDLEWKIILGKKNHR